MRKEESDAIRNLIDVISKAEHREGCLEEKLDKEQVRSNDLEEALRAKKHDIDWWSFTLGLLIGATIVGLLAIARGI